MSATEPTFDQWLDYAFTRGYADFQSLIPPPEPDSEEEALVHACQYPEPAYAARFLCQLMKSPRILIERFDRTQLADGLWYLFGIASETPRIAADPSVPLDVRLRWLRGIPNLYREVFDYLCCREGVEPDMQINDGDAFDNAVFMIWDMGQLDGACNVADLLPLDLDVELCAEILRDCRSSICRLSALHGLGHSLEWAVFEKLEAKASLLHQAIDDFLAMSPNVPEHVRAYAMMARDGAVL